MSAFTGFGADADGLRTALEMLVQRLAEPWMLPAVPPGTLPSALPENGLGERMALEQLASLALDGAAALRHPGFFAHMDPPTPWVAWAATQWAAANQSELAAPGTAPTMRDLVTVAAVTGQL